MYIHVKKKVRKYNLCQKQSKKILSYIIDFHASVQRFGG